jgi:AAA family ATP:ADP antiporter
MRLVGEQIPSSQGRTRLFALIDLVVNVLTFLIQMTVTSRVIGRFGLASALVLLPIASAIGFGVIAVMPFLILFVLFTIVRRVGEYALAKPAREVLFTVVTREEKYKAKNFIDTAVSRGGDAMTGWIVSGTKALGIATGQIAWVLVPLALLWGWVGWLLARQEAQLKLATPVVNHPPPKSPN